MEHGDGPTSVRPARARRCWPSGSPPSSALSFEEALECTKIHSISGCCPPTRPSLPPPVRHAASLRLRRRAGCPWRGRRLDPEAGRGEPGPPWHPLPGRAAGVQARGAGCPLGGCSASRWNMGSSPSPAPPRGPDPSAATRHPALRSRPRPHLFRRRLMITAMKASGAANGSGSPIECGLCYRALRFTDVDDSSCSVCRQRYRRRPSRRP